MNEGQDSGEQHLEGGGDNRPAASCASGSPGSGGAAGTVDSSNRYQNWTAEVLNASSLLNWGMRYKGAQMGFALGLMHRRMPSCAAWWSSMGQKIGSTLPP